MNKLTIEQQVQALNDSINKLNELSGKKFRIEQTDYGYSFYSSERYLIGGLKYEDMKRCLSVFIKGRNN